MAAEIGAIKTVLGLLKGVISPSTPSKALPTPAVLAGGRLKSGLSAIDIASEIIRRKKDIGIPISPLPSGGDNLDLMMETIRVEVIIEALLKDARIQVAIPPGTNVTVAGGNAGGPMVSQGVTTTITGAFGVIT